MIRKNFKIVLIVLGIVSVFAAFFGYDLFKNAPKNNWPIMELPAYTKINPHKPLEEQFYDVEIAGRSLRIPSIYFISAPEKGLKQKDLLLAVRWPDAASSYQVKLENPAAFNQQLTGNILIQEAADKPPLKVSMEALFNNFTKQERFDDVYGLEKFNLYRTYPDKPLLLKNQMFIKRNSQGDVTDFIYCAVGQMDFLPNCDLFFVDEGLRYEISFNQEKFLSEWESLRKNSAYLLKKFEGK